VAISINQSFGEISLVCDGVRSNGSSGSSAGLVGIGSLCMDLFYSIYRIKSGYFRGKHVFIMGSMDLSKKIHF
jgi:hypothetical protein